MAASSVRVNLISLLGLAVLALVVALTPEARQATIRAAEWMAGVEEKLEAARHEAEIPESPPAEEEGRSVGEDDMPPLLPPHVVVGPNGHYHPEPGYGWVTEDPADLRVQWFPGVRHPEHPHVLASTVPDQWRPEVGYDWANPSGVDDLSVTWRPHQPHPDHPNVVADEEEQQWHPAPGYAWADPDDPDDFTVVPRPPG